MDKFKTKKEFASFVKNANGIQLKKCGFGTFQKYLKSDKETHYLKPGQVHYLIPGTFYNLIPVWMRVVDINGIKKSFRKGFSKDLAFGCLSYGVIK